jgi:hypothetical protein
MRHPSRLLFILSIAVGIASRINAQTTVYVSTGSGHQILKLANAETSSPILTVLCTGSATFVPEDLVVGPDGFIYVANTTASQIWRLNPDAVAACDSSTDPGAELIYSGTNPANPEGPTFVSEPTNSSVASLDLLFNTRSGQGIWKLPGIASKPFGCGTSCAAPVQVVTGPAANSVGEGTDIGKKGELLAVDNANGKLFKYSFPFSNTSTPFISGINSPVGVAINTCGDILVATSKNLGRYNADSGALLDSISPFAGNDKGRFLEVDSSNHIYLVTAQDESGSGGTIWRLDPPTQNPLTSCSLKLFKVGIQISLKTSLGLASNNGLGLGVSATSVTSQAQCFSPAHPTNLYNFGTHSVAFTVTNASQQFCLQVTAAKSKRADVNFTNTFSCPAASSSNTTSFQVPQPVCLHYASGHAHCTQYLEQACTDSACSNKISDATLNSGQFCSGGACNFQGTVAYFTLDTIVFPGVAHVSTDNAADPTTEPYGSLPSNPTDDCQTLYFFPFNGGNGLDPVILRGSNSKHVVFNSNLLFPNSKILLSSPTSSCQTPTGCNPQFKSGSNISVKFSLSPQLSPANAATERLSIMRVQHTTPQGQVISGEQVIENVVATNNSSFQNFFGANSSGQYSYNEDSSFLQPLPKGSIGTYEFVIWGNATQTTQQNGAVFFVSVQF